MTAMASPLASLSDAAALRLARETAAQVADPELPMLTLADLGVLRGVELAADGTVVASLTPTYSGCPAMAEMRADTAARLRAVLVELQTQVEELAGFDLGGGVFQRLGPDVVERAAHVLGPPAAPVAQLLGHLVEIRRSHGGAPLCCR